MIVVDQKQRQENLKKYGKGLGRPAKLSDSDKDDMVSEYNTGHNITDIAKRHGISRATVYKVVRERTIDT